MMLVSRTSTAPDVTHAGHSVASPAPAAAVEAALRGFAGPRWPSAARFIIFEALVKVKLPPVGRSSSNVERGTVARFVMNSFDSGNAVCTFLIQLIRVS